MKARRRTDVHRARSLMRTGIRTSAHGGGDAPPHWLDVRRLRLYPLAALICYVILAIGWVVRRTVLHQPEVPPLALDFLPFWSASYLGLNGHALDAYDVIKLTRVEILVEPYMRDLNGIMPWLYPPTMLLFVLPLALLSFWVAYGVFAFGALLLFVRVVRMIAPWPQAIWPILGFPGITLVLVAGQAACLTAGLAGLSLCLLRRHAGWAGVCAGLLFVKPHLAILFPSRLARARGMPRNRADVLAAQSRCVRSGNPAGVPARRAGGTGHRCRGPSAFVQDAYCFYHGPHDACADISRLCLACHGGASGGCGRRERLAQAVHLSVARRRARDRQPADQSLSL